MRQEVREAAEVYVARPRMPDVWPGRSFRVERVLKGAVRSNLRAKVTWWGGGGSCATKVVSGERYVLTSHTPGIRPYVSLCSEHLRGDAAVREATAALGEGRAPPWRPDVAWLSQWLLIVVPVGFVLYRRRKKRHERDAAAGS